MNFSQDFDTLTESYQDLRRQVDKMDEYFIDAIQDILNRTEKNNRDFNKLYPWQLFAGKPAWAGWEEVIHIFYVDSQNIDAELLIKGRCGDGDSKQIYSFPIDLIKNYFQDKEKYNQYFTNMYNFAIASHENKLKKQVEDQLAKERAEFARLQVKFQN